MHDDARFLGAPFWEAVNQNLESERALRAQSSVLPGQRSLLPWMQHDWLNDEGFRSLHQHASLSALLDSQPMGTNRFGPTPSDEAAHSGLGWTYARQEFVVYRPLCFTADLGFFQTDAHGNPVKMDIENGQVHANPSSDRSALKKEISWVKGSTFAGVPWDLHVPHFFWELQAMFSLGLYASGSLQFDRLLILQNGRWWNCSEYGLRVPLEKLASGAQTLSFFEEFVISTIASNRPRWELMPWFPDVCPQLIQENKVTCFEQVVLQSPQGGTTFHCGNCARGFFGRAEAALFRQHTLEVHRLQPTTQAARGPGTSDKLRLMAIQRRSMRKVRKLEALVAVAHDMGVDIVVLILEDFSYREQLRHWSMRNAVVASTGAALVNIVLMPPGSHLIDIPLRHPSGLYFVPTCFYQSYALAIGVHFHVICGSECLVRAASCCQALPKVNCDSDERNGDWIYQDVVITPRMVEEFSKLLRGLGASNEAPSS